MYPKYVYHKKEGKKLIHSEKEEHEEWLENPGMHLHESHVEYVKPLEVDGAEEVKSETEVEVPKKAKAEKVPKKAKAE